VAWILWLVSQNTIVLETGTVQPFKGWITHTDLIGVCVAEVRLNPDFRGLIRLP
jgi:hypothetical protein